MASLISENHPYLVPAKSPRTIFHRAEYPRITLSWGPLITGWHPVPRRQDSQPVSIVPKPQNDPCQSSTTAAERVTEWRDDPSRDTLGSWDDRARTRIRLWNFWRALFSAASEVGAFQRNPGWPSYNGRIRGYGAASYASLVVRVMFASDDQREHTTEARIYGIASRTLWQAECDDSARKLAGRRLRRRCRRRRYPCRRRRYCLPGSWIVAATLGNGTRRAHAKNLGPLRLVGIKEGWDLAGTVLRSLPPFFIAFPDVR